MEKVQTANALVTRLVHLGAIGGLEADTIIDALDGLERELKWRRKRDRAIAQSSCLQSWQRVELMRFTWTESQTHMEPI